MVNRFLDAQDNGVYERALAEIQSGQKKSHWMWFIFPQLKGLGSSYTAEYYAIQNAEMARRYIEYSLLRKRLLEISQAVLDLNANNIADVFGYPDYLKFQSCMTLFSIIAPEYAVFAQNLNRYFNGTLCQYTKLINKGE